MVVSALMALGGIATAYTLYVIAPELPDLLSQRWREAYALSFNKWYVDEFYDRTIVQPTVALANGLWKFVEVELIDAMVNGVGAATVVWGLTLRLVQSGEVQHYALAMALGAVAILGLYLMLL
jgi:NADH-quinone oxidoreductase subunit L